MKAGSKYQPLLDYLRRCDRKQVTLTFSEIEAIAGISLPSSARQKRAWWSNRSKGALQACAWMEAGYLVGELNLAEERVTFHQPKTEYRIQRTGDTVLWNGELIKGLRRHMGFTQAQLADELGVRQQTISEWETGVYTPTRSTSKHLSLVAEQAGFKYEVT